MSRRRREREPVAYIVGSKGFRFLELAVDRRVLIPRPETEFVVEAALGLPAGARVVDVGHGLGRDRAGAEARAAGPGGVRDRRLRRRAGGRALERRAARPRREFVARRPAGRACEADAVVSNPPYVAAGDGADARRRRFEPRGALFARRGRARRDPPAGRARRCRSSRSSTARARPTPSRRSPARPASPRRARPRPRRHRAGGRCATLTRGRWARASRRAAWRSSRPTRSTGSRAIPTNRRDRAALRAQGPPAGQAGGDDVLRPASRCPPVGPRTRRAARAAAAGRGHADPARRARRARAVPRAGRPRGPAVLGQPRPASPTRGGSRTCRSRSAPAPTS